MQKTVYIFRGAPASGKTTLTRLLAKKLPKPIAILEQDYFRWGIHNFNKSKAKVLHNEHLLADKNFLSVFEQYLQDSRYTIIIDGSFTWDTNELGYIDSKKLINIANRYGFKCVNVLLKAERKILNKRNARRKYTVPAKVFDDMYDTLYKKIDNSEKIFDTTHLTKRQTLDLLVSNLLKVKPV